MSLYLIPATPRRLRTFLFSGQSAARVLRLILSGPRHLITSGLTAKSAALMILLCIPTLLVVAMITLPGMLFTSQQNEAYHFFARNLNHDLNNWAVLAVVAAFSLASLAVPALGQERLGKMES